MSLTTEFNVNPYYDDFDEDKKFLRILFKPGYSVQARELTQLQTIIQKQLEKIGNNIFINGNFISGGESFVQDCISLKLNPLYNSVSINPLVFSGVTIYNSDLSKRAEVIVAIKADSNSGDPGTLLIRQIYGAPFVAGEIIKNVGATSFAIISSTLPNAVGVGQAFSLNGGIFYYGGYFIKTDQQSIAVSKYSNNSASVKVGFEIFEYNISSSDDVSLLDPAQQATNYQAPGADRYKVELIISTRNLDAVSDLDNFIEITRFESGVLKPTTKPSIYNKIGDEMAKRTFEESGNYVLAPFSLIATSNTTDPTYIDFRIGSGRAYVRGYEIDVKAAQKISILAARDVTNLNTGQISGAYGNYFLTTNHANNFNINALATVDLHCVNLASIAVGTAAGIANTKIGTVSIKSMEFVTTSNTQNGNNYVYSIDLFQMNVGSLSSNSQVGGDSSNVKLSSGYSAINNAYAGGYLRFTSGPGSNDSPKLILSYDGTTKNATVFPPFSTIPTAASLYTIEFNTHHTLSLANISATNTIESGADILVLGGLDPSTVFAADQRAVLFDNVIEELIFDLPIPFPTSVTNVVYQYVKKIAGTLTSGSITLPTDTDLYGTATTEADIRTNYKMVCTSVGGSSYVLGQVIPSNALTITNGGTTAATIVVAGGLAMVFDLIVTMTTTGVNSRSKTYVPANTANISTLTGTAVIAGRVATFGANGQVQISANAVIGTPDTEQSLYLTDVLRLVKVLDFSNTTITETNALTAVDVTSRYKLDTGQRDSYYDHASIRLKAGQFAPKGPLVVYVDRLTHPTLGGYFSVDSYPVEMYSNCSTYTSSAGKYYNLRDCLDFRPSVQESSLTKAYNYSGTPKIIKRGSLATFTYRSYLPRVDKLTLNTDGQFNITTGVSAQNPTAPNNNDDSIALYEIKLPPYTSVGANVVLTLIPNKRYTMHDIGNLEKRISSLEYYTTLSLLENDALSKSDPSLYGRSRNGIITDSFTGFNTVDATSGDFTAGIDLQSSELKTSTVITPFDLRLIANNSTDYSKSSTLIYLTSNSNVVFVEQAAATNAVNVNPFNVQMFIGSIRLLPQSDNWIDTTVLPALDVQDAGNAAMRAFINDSNKWAEVSWGSWRNLGASTTVNNGWSVNTWSNSRSINTEHFENLKTSQNQSRTGTLVNYTAQEVKTSLGEHVVSSGVYPFVRKRDIWFKMSDFKPLSTSYGFFNTTNIDQYIAKHNVFTINLASSFANTAARLATIFSGINTEKNRGLVVNITNNSVVIGNATISHCSNNLLYATEINSQNVINWNAGTIQLTPNDPIIKNYFENDPYYITNGTPSWNLATSNAFTHYSGNVNVSTAATTTSFKLAAMANSASFAETSIVGLPIRLVSGGGGTTNTQSSTILTYTTSTRVVTFSPAFTAIPTANSVYNIGNFKTDKSGRAAGTFYLPGGTFRAPENTFRMTDDSLGRYEDSASTSRGDSLYIAQGQLKTTQETIISTVAPKQVISYQEQQQTVYSYSQVYRYTTAKKKDPVAETFTVDPILHPDGIFLSKVRLCFRAVDESLPVSIQIRPTVNGYPSSTQIYPFGEVSLLPTDITISDYPDLDDVTKYSDFILESPVYLLPGEHSFVVLTNSSKYEVWTATKNSPDVNTNKLVNNEPYLGSFFKSQNGSTWTAEQETDMMFRLYYHQFDASTTSSVIMEIRDTDLPTINAYCDLLVLQTQEIDIANTTLSYSFNSESTQSGTKTGYLPILPRKDYYMSDGYGRRVINYTASNNTFQLKISMQTKNADVSPIIDAERFSIMAIEQVLNTLSLSNSVMVVSNTGSYSNGSNIIISISGGGGTGATAVANVVRAFGTNTVDRIVITNAGTGYKTSPTINISGGLPVIWSAIASVNGEDSKRGGNSVCRYVTKRITLADGFESADLRVYLSAHRPAGASIDVYYKLLAPGDRDLWQDRKWQLMTQIPPNLSYYSENVDDFNELVFAPGINNVANNSIVYISNLSGQFNEFNTFAVKIVMSGTNTVDIPRIKDFRTIATQSI